MNISGVDLNLLLVLDALLRERSVTRAARKVGLSQPAVSHALGRLRAHYADPLFVRRARGLEPTPRAQQLSEPVARAVAEVEKALAPAAQFEPRSARRELLIMMSDLSELSLMPFLTASVRREAPGVTVRVVHGPTALPDDVLAARDAPDVVLSLLADGDDGPCRVALYRQAFVAMARRGHPCFSQRMTLARYLALEHVLVAPRGLPGGIVDDVLAARGKRRRIVLTTAHFFGAVRAMSQTDLVLSAPSILASVVADPFALRSFTLPLALPATRIGAFWHPRNDLDPAQRWFRGLLLDAARNATIAPRHRAKSARRR